MQEVDITDGVMVQQQKVEIIWSVYLIRNKMGALYCGISTDVARRFAEHQQGGIKAAKALKGKGPLELVFQQVVGNKSAAAKIESLIKKMNKKEKEKMVETQKMPECFFDKM